MECSCDIEFGAGRFNAGSWQPCGAQAQLVQVVKVHSVDTLGEALTCIQDWVPTNVFRHIAPHNAPRNLLEVVIKPAELVPTVSAALRRLCRALKEMFKFGGAIQPLFLRAQVKSALGMV